VITAFTIAHSVTLALAVLDLVVLPDRVVESAIALSIAIVAAENLWARGTVRGRWLAAFGFGLVHGFGFSAALRELALPRAGLVASLLGFNVGVEIGQAAVVAILLPLLLVARRAGVERRLAVACSVVILVVGVALTLVRAVLA
jgi:HupE/UreJ protein